MRSFFVVLIILGFAYVQSVCAADGLTLVGKVGKIELAEENNSILFSFDVSMTLTNTGSVPVLLFMPENSVCISRGIFGIAPGENSERRLFANFSLPSRSGRPEWEERKTLLNVAAPPSNLITKLEAGKSLTFERKQWFYIPRESVKSKPDVNFGNSSWNELSNAKALSLRLEFRFWPLDLETYSLENNPRFGKKLRKRWIKHGDLLLDDIKSDLISLDLNAAVWR